MRACRSISARFNPGTHPAPAAQGVLFLVADAVKIVTFTLISPRKNLGCRMLLYDMVSSVHTRTVKHCCAAT